MIGSESYGLQIEFGTPLAINDGITVLWVEHFLWMIFRDLLYAITVFRPFSSFAILLIGAIVIK